MPPKIPHMGWPLAPSARRVCYGGLGEDGEAGGGSWGEAEACVPPQGFLTPSPFQTKPERTGNGRWGGKAALGSKGLPKASAAEVSSRCPPLGSAGSMPQPSLLSSPGWRMHMEAHGHPRASQRDKLPHLQEQQFASGRANLHAVRGLQTH